MAKILPVMGIVGAVFAALCFAVLAPPATFIVFLVGLAGSIVLLMQRNLVGAVTGLVVLVLSVLAILGMMASVSTEDKSFDFGIGEDMGLVLGIAACLAIPVGALVVRWGDVEPNWLAIVGVACAAIAILLAFVQRDVLVDHFRAGTFIGVALSLLTIVPLVMLLRQPDEDAPVLAETDAPFGKAAVVKQPPSRRP